MPVTEEGIEKLIVEEIYMDTREAWQEERHEDPRGKTTICVLKLSNGYEVVGSSGCVDPGDFNVEMGREVARQNAVEKIWLIEGYKLQLENYKKLMAAKFD
jgi:hypothetical protein